MNLNPATVLDPVFHFLDWIIAEWCLSVSRVRMAVPDSDCVDIQRRVATEIPQSTARQRRHRHRHTATHTTATTNHHPRIRFVG
jgi:hypothetical protein